MTTLNIEALKAKLEEMSKKEMWTDSDDFNPCEQSGGNYDDAYYGGCEDGAVGLARELLEEFFK